MLRPWSYLLKIVALSATIALSLTAPLSAQTDVHAGVSLKILAEKTPPGATAQMKVVLTEPRPIMTGDARFDFGGFSIEGISLVSPANDTFGVAVVDNQGLTLSFISATGTFGNDSDYPILTFAGRVAETTPLGTTVPFGFAAGSLQMFDPSGALYPADVKDGTLTVAANLSVSDVRPGGGFLPAGSVVSIFGSGFEPKTKVRFKETLLQSVQYIDSSRIDVVLLDPARMDGMDIDVINPNGAQTNYFSYQRTKRAGTSTHPGLVSVVPLFPRDNRIDAVVNLQGAISALALQNVGASDATVNADLIGLDGQRVGNATLIVPAGQFLVNEILEIFRTWYSAGYSVKIEASGPVQVMGVALDETGHVRPVLPR